ncbi:MAG: pyridoxamine 5'-phosphate oxidase family protein [Saccharofermentans sp.]|nr:pyridoxamine 5'-phosphate oxidase family protein [Saccharofermentans sp.]
MFREMRRVKRAIPEQDAKALLKNNMRAALSVNGDDGYPYTVPVNFYYEEDENKIYFHSSRVGHKIESMKKNNKVCFTTWDDGYKDEGDWAYRVSSCVVFGRASLVEDEKIALEKIKKFAMKYYPTEEEADEEISKDFRAVQMVCIDIEHISGKKIHEK